MAFTNDDPEQSSGFYGASRKEAGSQSSDFRINQFNLGQSQFPKFGEIPSSPSIEDIRARVESSKSNGWGSQLARFLSQNKKRLLVLAGIVGLFAGSSYLSSQSEQPEGDKDSNNIAGITANNSLLEEKEGPDEQDSSKPLNIELGKDGQIVVGNENKAVEETKISANDSQSVPEAPRVTENTDSITATAQMGDGITHLARLAISEYLAKEDEALTSEQKIYAEDYVQNKTGNEMMEVNQTLSFSKDLIKQAVEKAKGLSNSQIENLKKYSAKVSLL